MRHQAIYNLYSNVVSIDDTKGAFDKNGNSVVLNESEINGEIAKIEANLVKFQYQKNRANEYPSFAEQFDLLYHGGYDAWKSAIDAIKNKYPKGA